MNFKQISAHIIAMALLLIIPLSLNAGEINGQYSTISYDNDKMLTAFNNTLFVGRFRFLLKEKKPITVEDEIRNKMDLITLKAEQILEMFPPHLHYAVTLCENNDKVQELFVKYNSANREDLPGFYLPLTDTVYLSAKDAELNVVAHEIGHVVVDKYFKTRPPVRVHELLAQFVERHIND